jgi:hypothetical protein
VFLAYSHLFTECSLRTRHMHGRVGGNSLAKKKGDDLFDLVDAVAKQPTPANTVVKKDKVEKRKQEK